MSKPEKLLKVREMPEDKQLMWLKEHRKEFGIDNHPSSYPLEGFPRACRFFLADLAFRLRDEAEQKNSIVFGVALVDVQQKVAPDFVENHYPALNAVEWFIRFAQPIHWIIAALIAKQKEAKE